MARKVAIDNNIYRYLLDALDPLYNPSHDLEKNKKLQRRAILSCFFYSSTFYIPPSVEREYLKTKKLDLKKLFISSHIVLFLDIVPPPPIDQVIALKNVYIKIHRKDMDCQILSEAEVGDMNIFLTFDKKFYKKLKDKTIKIIYPTEYLKTLNIQKGTKPVFTSAPGHPLFKKQYLWRI